MNQFYNNNNNLIIIIIIGEKITSSLTFQHLPQIDLIKKGKEKVCVGVCEYDRQA